MYIMLTSKQRAYLRGMANNLEPVFLIGKSGLTETIMNEIGNALEARELIKVKVLNNSMIDVREAGTEIAQYLNADVVQVIGGKFVLYRPSTENPRIVLQ
jgi:RNA-binding protein